MIPNFLRRENQHKTSEMKKAINKYIEHFGNDLITETASYSEEEWIKILNYCVENNITIWEYWGEEYDPKADY